MSSSSSATGSAKEGAASSYASLTPSSQRTDPSSFFIFTALPKGSEDRAIIRFVPTGGVCTAGTGFQGNDRVKPPAPLAARGVTEEEWRSFTLKLEQDVQSFNTGGLCLCLAWTVLVCAPVACYVQSRYNRALGAWVNQLNKQVLEPKGMYAKFQTVQVNSDKYHEEQSWLAVALSADDAEILKQEAVFWKPACCDSRHIVKDTCQCKSCCGVERIVV
jgi:hypothetical protein